MGTAVLVTSIICGTIIYTFTISLIVNHKSKEDAKKALNKLAETFLDDESEE